MAERFKSLRTLGDFLKVFEVEVLDYVKKPLASFAVEGRGSLLAYSKPRGDFVVADVEYEVLKRSPTSAHTVRKGELVGFFDSVKDGEQGGRYFVSHHEVGATVLLEGHLVRGVALD